MAQRNPFDNQGGGSGDGSGDDDEIDGQTSPVAGRTPPDDATDQADEQPDTVTGDPLPESDGDIGSGTDEPTPDPGSSPAPPRGEAPPDDTTDQTDEQPDTVTGDPLPESDGDIGSGTDEPTPDPGSSPAPPRGEAPPDDTTDQADEQPDTVTGDPLPESDEAIDSEPETDPGRSPAPPRGEAPPDDTDEPEMDPGSSPAPPGGRTPPDDTTDQPDSPAPDPREPEGIQSERATDLREEVAGQSDLFTQRDVTVEQTDDGLRGFVPEQVQRQVLREEAASRTDAYGPADFSIRETDGGLEAFVGDEAEREQVQEATAEELGIDESRVIVEERQLDSSPPGGQAPPDTQYDVSIDTSGTFESGGGTDQTLGESQEQLDESLSDPDSVTNQDVQTSDFGQTTDTTFDPSDHPQGLADALIDSDTAQSVSARGSVISGAIVTGLQDAGDFVATGEGADEAGVAGDVVGGGLEGRAEGLGEFVTQPVEGTRAGSATESAITGALGTAPGAIAQAPGDVALLARRGEQAGRQVAAEPGTAGDVATTAAGYGVAGTTSSARAVADAPIREGVAIGALFLGTGGAASGARATAQRARSADVSVPDSVPGNVERFVRDERATAQVPRSQRTRQVDEPDEPMTIEGGDLQDPSRMGRHVPEQRYGEYELGPSQPTRLEGVTPEMGGRTTGPRSRTRRAQERQVRVGDPDLPGAVRAGTAAGSADVVGEELARAERAQQQEVQIGMQRNVADIDTTTATDTDVGQRIAIGPRQTTDQRAARVTTNVPTTTSTSGGSTSDRGGRPTPRIPRLPDDPESGGEFGMGDTVDEEFSDVNVGSYIDPL